MSHDDCHISHVLYRFKNITCITSFSFDDFAVSIPIINMLLIMKPFHMYGSLFGIYNILSLDTVE